MYIFYPMALLAGFLTWILISYMDNNDEVQPSRTSKHQ